MFLAVFLIKISHIKKTGLLGKVFHSAEKSNNYIPFSITFFRAISAFIIAVNLAYHLANELELSTKTKGIHKCIYKYESISFKTFLKKPKKHHRDLYKSLNYLHRLLKTKTN